MGTRTNEGTVAMHACNEALRCNCGAADTRVSKAAAWLPSLVGPLARIREQSRWGILNSYWPGHTGRPLGAGRFIGGYTRIWGEIGVRGCEKRNRCWQRSGGGRTRRHLQLDNWKRGRLGDACSRVRSANVLQVDIPLSIAEIWEIMSE